MNQTVEASQRATFSDPRLKVNTAQNVRTEELIETH